MLHNVRVDLALAALFHHLCLHVRQPVCVRHTCVLVLVCASQCVSVRQCSSSSRSASSADLPRRPLDANILLTRARSLTCTKPECRTSFVILNIMVSVLIVTLGGAMQGRKPKKITPALPFDKLRLIYKRWKVRRPLPWLLYPEP